MISWLFHWVDRTTHVTPALRMFLWWGVALRTTLLFALGTLLAVEGNFLAEWLLSWQVAPASASEIQEYTMVSYVALIAFLSAGVVARLATLYRLQDDASGGASPEKEKSDADVDPDNSTAKFGDKPEGRPASSAPKANPEAHPEAPGAEEAPNHSSA